MKKTKKQRHNDHFRWLLCGCGGVDDSKNAPGMDRTDDIKKGTREKDTGENSVSQTRPLLPVRRIAVLHPIVVQ
jgi:hypothetical protein